MQIWDTTKCKLIRSMDGHCGRVGVLAWHQAMLSSGSRDASIIQRDVRSPREALAVLHGHAQEVCGLKWAPNGSQLASGGNDNLLNVWDDRRHGTDRRQPSAAPLYTLTHHKAAVKALAWCPWQRHVLASGGGTADRMIMFWNMQTGTFVNAVDTHSQVHCARTPRLAASLCGMPRRHDAAHVNHGVASLACAHPPSGARAPTCLPRGCLAKSVPRK